MLAAAANAGQSGFDGWAVAQWVFNVLIAIAMAYVASKNQKIETLGEEIKKSNEKRIEERFTALRETIGLHLTPLLQRIDDVCGRLKDGDESMRALGDRDQQVELKMVQRIDALKDYIREECASTKDLGELRNEMHKLSETVQRLFRSK